MNACCFVVDVMCQSNRQCCCCCWLLPARPPYLVSWSECATEDAAVCIKAAAVVLGEQLGNVQHQRTCSSMTRHSTAQRSQGSRCCRTISDWRAMLHFLMFDTSLQQQVHQSPAQPHAPPPTSGKASLRTNTQHQLPSQLLSPPPLPSPSSFPQQSPSPQQFPIT